MRSNAEDASGVTGQMWATLVATTIAASMVLVDQTAVPLAIPRAVNDLGGSLDDSQWIMTANILPLAAFMVLGGRLGDLLGLRRVFLVGALVFAAATTVAGFSQDMEMMIGARLRAGLQRRAADAHVDGDRVGDRSRRPGAGSRSASWPAARRALRRSAPCWAAS